MRGSRRMCLSGKGRDFNARVGRSTDADDGIGT